MTKILACSKHPIGPDPLQIGDLSLEINEKAGGKRDDCDDGLPAASEVEPDEASDNPEDEGNPYEVLLQDVILRGLHDEPIFEEIVKGKNEPYFA
jgi:hypothetical protein